MTTSQDTVHGHREQLYKIVFDIDIDCEELLDAIGLDYTRSELDDTQNVVEIELDADEYHDALWTMHMDEANEQEVAARILNIELSEYTTSAVIEKPNGDRIIFE